MAVADGRYRVRTANGQVFTWVGDWPHVLAVAVGPQDDAGPDYAAWLNCEGDVHVQVAHIESVELIAQLPSGSKEKS
jgi:hypothetical protein